MKSEFPFLIYYFGLLIATIFLSKFIFQKYISFASRYKLAKPSGPRAAHKGNVFTGGGVVYAAVLMVAAVILDNLDFVEFSNFSPRHQQNLQLGNWIGNLVGDNPNVSLLHRGQKIIVIHCISDLGTKKHCNSLHF